MCECACVCWAARDSVEPVPDPRGWRSSAARAPGRLRGRRLGFVPLAPLCKPSAQRAGNARKGTRVCEVCTLQEHGQGWGPAPGFRGDIPLLGSQSRALPGGPRGGLRSPGSGIRPCPSPWPGRGAAVWLRDPRTLPAGSPSRTPGGTRASLAGSWALLAALGLGQLEPSADPQSRCPQPAVPGPRRRVGVAGRHPPTLSPARSRESGGHRPGLAPRRAGPLGRKKLGWGAVKVLGNFST